MKKVTAKHFYPFDIETLIRAFHEEADILAKLENSGAKDITLDIEDTDSGFNVSIERSMPADVPSVLKSFLGEWNEVKQTETWTGSNDSGYRCDLTIDIEGVPVSIKGKLEITHADLITTNNIEFAVSAGIPLVGGQLEKFVVGNMEKSIAEEFEFIKAHLG